MHIIIRQHIYIPSCNISSTSYSYKTRPLETDNITLSFQVCTKANSKQKCMNTTHEHEKGTTLLGYSPWRATLLVVASKHCSLLHNRSSW